MDDQPASPQFDLLGFMADLVAAYVSNNSLPVSELPSLIVGIHAALQSLTSAAAIETPKTEPLTPAQIRKSITPEVLISFEDGKPYKTLRRHLTLRGLSPETYREKWGLPFDYPMTSAAYSAQRSELARSLGLGQQGRKPAAVAAEDKQAPGEAVPAKRRGRPAKAKVSIDA